MESLNYAGEDPERRRRMRLDNQTERLQRHRQSLVGERVLVVFEGGMEWEGVVAAHYKASAYDIEWTDDDGALSVTRETLSGCHLAKWPSKSTLNRNGKPVGWEVVRR